MSLASLRVGKGTKREKKQLLKIEKRNGRRKKERKKKNKRKEKKEEMKAKENRGGKGIGNKKKGTNQPKEETEKVRR